MTDTTFYKQVIQLEPNTIYRQHYRVIGMVSRIDWESLNSEHFIECTRCNRRYKVFTWYLTTNRLSDACLCQKQDVKLYKDLTIKDRLYDCVEYRSWINVKLKVKPGAKSYQPLITVDPRWLINGGFLNFIRDVGGKPHVNYTLARYDTMDNFNKSNCYWREYDYLRLYQPH